MGTPGLVAWITANKIFVACTAAAVVTTGGAVVVVTEDGPPTVSVGALEAAPASPVDEDETAVSEVEVDREAEDETPVEEVATEEEPDASDEAKVVQTVEDEAPDDEKNAAGDEENVDLAVTARADGSRVVADLHNLGDATSGRVKVKLQTRGADAAVRVLEHSGAAECGSWYCWFDAAPPGEDVGTVVFAVDRLACATRDGGAKVIAHYEGDDADWDNNSAWAGLCTDVVVDEKKHEKDHGKEHDAKDTDLRLTLAGGPDEFVATVHNDGPAVPGRVKVKMHGIDGAQGGISILSANGPVAGCDGWYCYFEDLPVGASVASVRFGVDLEHCWHAEGGATVEVHTDRDRDHSNDTRRARWCEASDVENGRGDRGEGEGDEGDEKARAALTVDVEGTAASYRVRVTNDGDTVVRNVQLQHWIKDGEAEITLIEASPARCVAEGCDVGDLAPGASAWIRVSADVDCDRFPETRAKGYVEGVGHAFLELC